MFIAEELLTQPFYLWLTISSPMTLRDPSGTGEAVNIGPAETVCMIPCCTHSGVRSFEGRLKNLYLGSATLLEIGKRFPT